jgi:hypothetical protein
MLKVGEICQVARAFRSDRMRKHEVLMAGKRTPTCNGRVIVW